MNEEKRLVFFDSMYDFVKNSDITNLKNTKLAKGEEYLIFHFRPINQSVFECDLQRREISDGELYVYVNWGEVSLEEYLLEDSILDEVFGIYRWDDEEKAYHCCSKVFQNEEKARKELESWKKADKENEESNK